MPHTDPSLSIAQRVDLACDRFEADWKAGKRPKIADFVSASPESDRESLRQALLAIELELRGRSEAETSVTQSSVRNPVDISLTASALHPTTSSDGLKKIGRFDLRGVLGSGAFGKVYRAFDSKLGREVAIKVPMDSTVKTDAERVQFLKEARAIATINHPNVCQVFEVGEFGDRPYIVMALVPGLSLADALKSRKTPLPQKQVAMIIRKIASALAAAHEKGIVHRDLKPANIMFDRERKDIVVMDFGLARGPQLADARSTQSGVIMGTPAYMSPEQARGDAKGVGPSGDVFSLGVILYEMLTGCRPFVGTATEVIGQILHVEPERPSQRRAEIDLRMESICLKAMAKDPAARFSSMKEFAAAIDPLLRESTALSSPGETARAEKTRGAGERESAGDTNLADVFAVMSAERKKSQAETAAVVEAAIRKTRTPRWVLIALGLVGILGIATLSGLIFFTKSGPVTVTVELNDIDLTDQSLSFFLDDQPISAEALANPVELKPGEHILVVKRGDSVVKRMRLNVTGGRNPGIKVKDITLPNEIANAENVPKQAIAPFSAEQAKQYQEAWAEHLGVPVEYTNSIGMKFRLIPPGEYWRGTPADEIDRLLKATKSDDRPSGDVKGVDLIASEGPQHRVVLTTARYLAVTEVTQEHYQRVMGVNPSVFSTDGSDQDFGRRVKGMQTPSFPVDGVNWHDANKFCDKLCQLEGILTNRTNGPNETTVYPWQGYRLPTEAEWEFACRAGTTTRFWNGNDAGEISKIAWIFANTGGRTHAVGELPANPFGLYDMHGNLYEWVQDGWQPNAYEQYAPQLANDPFSTTTGTTKRVLRGGIWSYGANFARASSRMAMNAETSFYMPGFRVSLSVDAVKKSLQKARDSNGFVPLFNGKDLSGWVLESNDTENWKVQDGSIVATDARGDKEKESWLLFEKSYGDFVARFEFLAENTLLNSGFAIRAVPGEKPTVGDPPRPTPRPAHLKVVLMPAEPGARSLLTAIAKTGDVIGNYDPEIDLFSKLVDEQKPAGQWNEMEVELIGQSIRVRLNGKLIHEASLDDLIKKGGKYAGLNRRDGRIGFHRLNGAVRFRNIRMKELGKEQVIKVDDHDRRAAEYLLSLGGGFVKVNGKDQPIRQVNGLPTEPFRLTFGYFAEVKALDDDGLAYLKDCVHLSGLDLRSTSVTEKGLEIFRGKTNFTSLGLAYLRVTDKGLEIFKDNKGLKTLMLHDTFITDKGLKLFHDCKELGLIWVSGTPITDAGVLPFRECTFLKWLDVRATKVTRDGVQTMKAALPACRIDADPGKQ